jgi:O-methyltransferase
MKRIFPVSRIHRQMPNRPWWSNLFLFFGAQSICFLSLEGNICTRLVETVKKLLFKLLRLFGLSLSRIPSTGLLIDHEYQEKFETVFSIVKPYSMLSRARLSVLFEFVQYVHAANIPGSIIECGVWKGGAVGMMAMACQHFRADRDLHLFDVFDDIGEPDATVDGERAIREAGGMEHAHGRLLPLKGVYDRSGGHGTIDICKELLEKTIGYPSDKIYYHKGWFQTTMADAVPEIKGVAILRIDADWYASTKISLETFYDRVSRGGVLIIDDYGAYDGCRKAVDEFRQRRNMKLFRNHVDDECIYWFKE